MSRTLILALVSLSTVVAACAPEDDTAAIELTAGPSQCPAGPPWIAQFDGDGDHRIALADLPERMRERLAAADTNHDGQLDRSELAAAMRARAEARFAEADSDGDGALTAAEVGDADRWARIVLADGDGDGAVTLAELRAAFAAGVVSPPCHEGRPGRP